MCYDVATILHEAGKAMKEYFAKLKYLFKWRDLAFTVLLFTLILTVAFCRAEDMIKVTFGDDALDVVTSRYSMNIPYDQIESVEIGTLGKDDVIIKGKGDIALRTGHCSNNVWGEYYGIIDLQTSKCVLVRLDDGRLFVFSHQSDEKVQSDAETLQTYLNK